MLYISLLTDGRMHTGHILDRIYRISLIFSASRMEALNRNPLAAEMYLLKQALVSSFFNGYLACYIDHVFRRRRIDIFWLSSGKPKMNNPNHPVHPVKLNIGSRCKTDTVIYDIQE